MRNIKKYLPLFLIVSAALFFVISLRGLVSSPPKRKQTPLSKMHAKDNKSFVVIIPSYNNEKYCEKNLKSVLEQDYSHYRVVYIDDASRDRTFEKVQALIKEAHAEERVTLIHNEANRGAMANFFLGIHLCKDDEIAVMLDGDDWLAHDQVLDWLNRLYADPNVWMSYGSACEYPSYKRSEARHGIPQNVHEDHCYREFTKNKFVITHLKTAYAGLLKKVKVDDLFLDGQFLPATSDEALMLPAIEMAKEHARYVREILYVYNRQTPINDDKVRFELQQRCKNHILDRPAYQPIAHWSENEKTMDLSNEPVAKLFGS